MPRCGAAVRASLIAMLVLAIAGDSASARNFVLRNGERGFKIAWSEFRFETEAVAEQVSCAITLEGSFHSATLLKVRRAEIGKITRAASGSCRGGRAVAVVATLPWAFQYDAFVGTLPLIRELKFRIPGAQFEIQWPGFLRCVATTTDASPMSAMARTPEVGLGVHDISTVRLDETATIRLSGEAGLCEVASAAFAGEGTTTVVGETAAPRFALI